MARMKKVTIVERHGGFVVEYRDRTGRRPRPWFVTLKEAEAEQTRVEALLKAPLSEASMLSILSAQSKALKKNSFRSAVKDYRAITKPRSVGMTWKNDRYILEDLFLWLARDCELGKHFTVDQVDRIHVERFQSKLLEGWDKRKALSPSTVNRKFNTYRAFFNACVDWSFTSVSPITGIKWLPECPPAIRLPGEGTVERALEQIPTCAARALAFLQETGRRPVDAERANIEDVSIENPGIWVTSYKGRINSRQFFPLSERALEICLEQIADAKKRFQGRPSDPLFADEKGARIGSAKLGRVLRKYGFRANTGLTSYRLRHAFVDGLVDHGTHYRDIQVLAGHKKWETTTRYTHRRVDRLRDIVNDFSKDRMGGEQLGEKAVKTGQIRD